MIRFFCTRCGVQLQLPAVDGGPVRCGHCQNVVRSPGAIPLARVAVNPPPLPEMVDQLAAALPENRLAATGDVVSLASADAAAPADPRAETHVPMSATVMTPDGVSAGAVELVSPMLGSAVPFGTSAPPVPWLALQRDSSDAIAERLCRVQTTEGDESRMTNCPHCGSTIAPYIGRCPFCRHPLHGS